MPSKRSRRRKGALAPSLLSRRWPLLALVAVVVAAGAIWLWQQGQAGRGGPLEVSVAEAAARRQAGAFILDVREPHEWLEVHIPGATLIPLAQLPARLSELPRGREIVVVCRSGNRSADGRDILRQAGFAPVTSMAGGMIDWQAAGYEIASGP
jgi:rhodanese-related sulfurtransferase